jgi:RNA polymerase sigma-70 factor (ECF subfamily)
VLRCQAGDEAAFAELVQRYHRRVRYFLQKLLAPPPDRLDDLLQDVWLDVFRSIGRLREPRAFAGWLYRLARDHAYRTLRRQRVPATVELLDADAQIPGGDDEPSFSAAEAQEIQLALDRLTPEHREVLLLRFVEDMSYDDIAAVVGCGVGTVRSRIHYGKRALRALIQPEKPTCPLTHSVRN